jgi:thiamine pyrophosphokinase
MKVIVWVLQDTAAMRLTAASCTGDFDSNNVISFKNYPQSKQTEAQRQSEKMA